MFGIFPTLLALLVVGAHLGPVDRVGPYAVFGFYVLSGYLMTTIMRERYGYTRQGIARYAANRLLRIYPLYLVAMAISVALIAWLGDAVARQFHSEMGLDASGEEVLRNVFLILGIETRTRWVPPAWALTVELFFYAAIGLGLSRHRIICLCWLAASVAYTAYLLLGGASFSYRYFTIAAASLPFAMGACLHHWLQQPSSRLRMLRRNGALPVLAAAFIANLLAADTVAASLATGWLFYLNLCLAWLLIAHLALRERSDLARRLDGPIGDLSYPIYLLHYQAGLVLLLAGLDAQRGEMNFLLWGGVLTVLMAWAACRLLEPAIHRVRAGIRPATPAEA